MKSIFQGIQPEKLFDAFEAICQIPHGSYNCKAIADYCQGEAERSGCSVLRDEADNLIITIPPSPGYEAAPAVILQGHLDMVCEKTSDTSHSFADDSLQLKIEGDYISAEGTTLGGDDGIAVAMILTLAADKTIPHGKLYGILTSDEEVGMLGAQALDCHPVADAPYMINIDSEAESIFYAGCAGGAKFSAAFPLRFVKAKGLVTTITVSGLDGGHSGADIDHYGNNAAVLLAEVLNHLNEDYNISIISINGGEHDNVIPDHAEAQILVGPNQQEDIAACIRQLETENRKIRPGVDKGLSISALFGETREAMVFGRDSEQLALFAITCMPNGIMTAGLSTPGIVDTSCNLGIIATRDKQLILSSLIRSNRVSSRKRMLDRMTLFTQYLGGIVTISGIYPPWEYIPDSPLQKLMADTWMALYGKAPTITTMHAGLECGFFAEKLPDLDIISIGPDIPDIHTPKERLSISSTGRIWDFLCAVLAKIKGNTD